MDEYAKNRARFKDKLRKVTKKDYNSLSDRNKDRFDRIKEKGLIAATRGGPYKTVIAFDPTTFERVSSKEYGLKPFAPYKSIPIQKGPIDKRYDSGTGQATPTSSPLKYASRGPDSPRGRPASRSSEKNG